MNKRLAGFMFVLFPVILIGQTLLTQDFSGGVMPPTGWTISALPAQWSSSQTNLAGGTAPEAKFTYTSGTNTSRLISPNINTTGKTQVGLDFRQYLDHYATGYTVGLATRSSNGTWNNVWTINPSGNLGPELKSIVISNSDVGSATFQFCFFITGNLYNIDYWYLDNVVLYAPFNLDAAMQNIITPIFNADYEEVTGTLKNSGFTTISSLEINYQIDNGEIHVNQYGGLNIPFNGIYSFTCSPPMHLPMGSYVLKVWINKVNGTTDYDPSNNLLTKTIQIICHTVVSKPCFEEFTSSTCPPCATFNLSFVPWCANHVNDITLIKYQMNWPGSGDPYYTAEGGVRRSFYGVTWVPWLVLNGVFTDTEISAVQYGYDNALNHPGIASIVSSFTQNGTSMNINSTILPYYNLSNIKVFVAVFENKTTGNVGTNGETEFHHVMMKMVPDANGTTVSLTDRVPYILNQSVNLAGTNVEDYNDLGVIVILQNTTTKEVYQSAYSVKNGTFANNSLLADLTIDGVSVPGFSPAQFVYNIELPFGTTEIPVVQATSADPGASVIVLQSFNLPGTATVNVFAQNLQTQSNYSINFTVAEHIVLELKAYLEGPFNGTEMVNSLNLSGQIQLSQPYNVAPWNYEGTESVSTIPENAIDWVLIEIRDATSAANATSATRIGRQAGFILNNGDIVSTDGNPMLFATGVSNNLFVIVNHRNHLGILSSNGLTQSGGNYSYDFTTSFGQTYGGILGCKEISTGIWGMISGDADSDGMVLPEDMNIFWYPTAGLPGYAPEDFNLDGQVNNPDKDDCWNNNIGKVCQVPD